MNPYSPPVEVSDRPQSPPRLFLSFIGLFSVGAMMNWADWVAHPTLRNASFPFWTLAWVVAVCVAIAMHREHRKLADQPEVKQ